MLLDMYHEFVESLLSSFHIKELTSKYSVPRGSHIAVMPVSESFRVTLFFHLMP